MFNFNTKKTDVQNINFQAQEMLSKLVVDGKIEDFLKGIRVNYLRETKENIRF